MGVECRDAADGARPRCGVGRRSSPERAGDAARHRRPPDLVHGQAIVVPCGYLGDPGQAGDYHGGQAAGVGAEQAIPPGQHVPAAEQRQCVVIAGRDAGRPRPPGSSPAAARRSSCRCRADRGVRAPSPDRPVRAQDQREGAAAAMASTVGTLMPDTCSGVAEAVVVPSPSWPALLSPQVHTVLTDTRRARRTWTRTAMADEPPRRSGSR